jgi:hypothetical protein
MKAVYLKSHNGMTLFHTYDKEPFRQRVRAFMQSVDGKGGINCRAPAVVDAARPAHKPRQNSLYEIGELSRPCNIGVSHHR